MIDAYSSLSHYATDHLAPIWHALPEPERGTFWCEPRVAPSLTACGITPTVGRPRRPSRLVVVAGTHDVWIVAKAGHPAVLVEHGAGQGYPECPSDPGWSGGDKREGVVLFLCPNEVSATRNRITYPNTPSLVVGSPRTDVLRRIVREPSERPVVALSFHHMGTGRCPAAGWALPHYEAGLPAAAEQMRRDGCEVIGHGHPRARRHFARLWKSLGVEHVERFSDVVRRASVYVCDNSSTSIEAAACGIPQVLMDCPAYEGAAGWWRFAEPGRDLGLHVADPDELDLAVVWALREQPTMAARRMRAVRAVLPQSDGEAAQRSADAVLALVADGSKMVG